MTGPSALPTLVVGGRRHTLRLGQNFLGGEGTNRVADPELTALPTAAVITVKAGVASTIHRISAAVVVKADGATIAATPIELRDGARIELRGVVAHFEGGSMGGSSAPATRIGAAALPDADARLVHVASGRATPLRGAHATIGREAGCDVHLDASGVSRVHGTLSREPDGWVLTDQSSNGTLVNGELVRGPRTLRDGDVIRMHTEELRFEMRGAALAAKAPAATRLVAAGSPLDDLRGADGARRSAKLAPQLATLEVRSGKLAGAVFRLERPVSSIGRSEQSDIRIADDSVSSAHATLLRKGESWFISDLRSANGTFVDGYRVAGERELPPGATIKVGRVELAFRLANEQEAAPGSGTRILRGLASLLRGGG